MRVQTQISVSIMIAIAGVTGIYVYVSRMLGAGIASTFAGWLIGSASVLHHITTKQLTAPSKKQTYLYFGFFLILTSLLCSYIVTFNAVGIRLPMIQKLSTISPSSPEAFAITQKLYEVDALIELIKNTFLVVSAALGANFIFSGLTVSSTSPSDD